MDESLHVFWYLDEKKCLRIRHTSGSGPFKTYHAQIWVSFFRHYNYYVTETP